MVAGWINYLNESPNTLRELYWHLYQNLFRHDSRGQQAEQIVRRRMTTTRGTTVHPVEAGRALFAGELPEQLVSVQRVPVTHRGFAG